MDAEERMDALAELAQQRAEFAQTAPAPKAVRP